MAMLAAFNLATAPAQPQSAASPVPNGINPSTYTYWSIVLSPSYLFRPSNEPVIGSPL
jgi:hypothetical protein